MSAVKWFAKELYEKFEMKGDGNVLDDILEQAKEMEKEQGGYTESDMRAYATYILNHPVIEPRQWYKIYRKSTKDGTH